MTEFHFPEMKFWLGLQREKKKEITLSSLSFLLFMFVFIFSKSGLGLNHFLHQNFIHNAGDCFDISAEKMLDGKNNLPPEWHVHKFFLPQNGLLCLFPGRVAKLPKSAGEICGWNFGRINLGIDFLLL